MSGESQPIHLRWQGFLASALPGAKEMLSPSSDHCKGLLPISEPLQSATPSPEGLDPHTSVPCSCQSYHYPLESSFHRKNCDLHAAQGHARNRMGTS